jgi:hypothetical protein
VAHVSADGPDGDCWRLNARPAHPRPVKVMAIIALAFTTAPLHLVHGCPGCAAPCRHVAGPSGAAALLPASMWAVCVLAAIGAVVILKRALCGLHQTKTGCERGLPPPRCKGVCGPRSRRKYRSGGGPYSARHRKLCGPRV